MAFNVVEYLNLLIEKDSTFVSDITSPGDLPMNWRVDFEERAAILEYDGGLSREDADTQALEEILDRIRNGD